MVANEAGDKKLVGFYPGMDDGPAAPYDMTGLADENTSDLNIWGSDILSHPDILSASADKFDHEAEGKDKKNKDDDFAVNYSCYDLGSVTNGSPKLDKKRLFKIKNDKGDFDRTRLISAYNALTGRRGDTHLINDIPSRVKGHAMALVRHGLKATKPNIKKENSSIMDPEIQALEARIAEMTAAKKLYSAADFAAVETRAATAETELATLKASIAEKETAVTTLKAALEDANKVIGEYKATALASERLAALEAVHPFSEDEKKAESFPEFVKSLASLTEDGLENAKLKRTIASMQASIKETPSRVLAAVRTTPSVNPVPATGAALVEGHPALGLGDLY
jgi:hypothetical protein